MQADSLMADTTGQRCRQGLGEQEELQCLGVKKQGEKNYIKLSTESCSSEKGATWWKL